MIDTTTLERPSSAADSFGVSDRPALARRSTAPGRQADAASRPIAGRAPHTATRRVLVIASRFPPQASVGAIRVRKFCQYLRLHGWSPVVLTGAIDGDETSDAEAARRVRDDDALADVPADVPVHRLAAGCERWPLRGADRLSEWLGALTGRFGLGEQRWRQGLAWRVGGWHERLSCPDIGVWSMPAAVWSAWRLHRRYRFSAIFSSAMPFSDHLAALCVARLIARPWVADFRDPWVDYVHWRQWRGSVSERFSRAAEAACVRQARFVVSIGELMRDRFARRYPPAWRRKFVFVRNGFDPADFDRCDADEDRSGFRLLYSGSLYGRRGPIPIIQAFRRFIARHPESRSTARLEFAGRAGPHADALRSAARDGVVFHGMRPHRDAIALMKQAAALLLIQPDQAGTEIDMSAKLYEYLGSGRPILAAIPPGGDAAKLLRAFDGVSIVPPDDVEGLAAAIAALHEGWRRHAAPPCRPAAALRPLTRPFQAQQLAALLDASTGRLAQTVAAPGEPR